MKQCPNCRTTYADDSLRFCLNDGASLVSASNQAETVRLPPDTNSVRINVPPDSAPTVFAAAPPAASTQPPRRKSAGLIIAAVFGLLLFLLLGGVAAFFLLLRPTDDKKAIVAASPSPIALPSAPLTNMPTDETAALKEKLANLEKQMRERNNQKPNAPPDVSPPPPKRQTMPTTARANSPRDGFLALRSEPDSETGARIAKIPHGASLTVLGCPKSSNAGKIAGRWCQVIYNGQSGWAFDAFMSF